MANEPAPARYHPAHVALHWLTGFMVIGSIVIGMVFLDSPNTPEKIPYLQLHSLWGFILALLLIARVITLLLFKRPAAATAGNPILDRVAQIVHILLYVGVFVMIFSGFGTSLQANLMAVYQGQASLPGDFMVYPPRLVHGTMFSLLFILILVHVGAAFYHQFILKDRLLSRMWFGKR